MKIVNGLEIRDWKSALFAGDASVAFHFMVLRVCDAGHRGGCKVYLDHFFM